MVEHNLVSLSIVVILGIAAQWMGWRMRIPSILLLLIFGILAGPVFGWINPGELLGSLLYPVVSLAVAMILFEGGLSLSMKEFRAIGGVTAWLVTVGAAITWFIVAVASHWILGLDWSLAILLGAVLVVTGPTVIGPMLQFIRPTGQTGAILKWEGIMIDPIGAMLAVLVFQVILESGGRQPEMIVLITVLKTIGIGTLSGLLGALILGFCMKRNYIPDYLHNPVALMFVIASFTGANIFQSESGLLAVTIMGFALANQKSVSIQHIVEFKENLRVLLIAGVFILLAAHLKPADLDQIGIGSFIFLLVLVLVARPASVFVSTFGSKLSTKEKLFLSWMAPRGIVAAAVASIFALRLEEVGLTGAEALVPQTFFVIIGTVALYGLTAPLVARRLNLAKAHPQGVLFLGGQHWVRKMAKTLLDEGYPVMLVDNSRHNILAARNAGIPAFYASIFADNVLDRVEISGIGKLMAMTNNDDVNSLAALHFATLFGRSQTYQLIPEDEKLLDAHSRHLRGNILFGKGMTHSALTEWFTDDAVINKTKLSEEYGLEELKSQYVDKVLPLFLITEGGDLQIFTAESSTKPQAGQTLISLLLSQPDVIESAKEVSSDKIGDEQIA
ncbi:cation:proton antiporter [Candidatus Nitrotoga sp. M5]|uniref:cation:proton antiporter n=1 Tax=Candidatus Nitrotoga sp. M5 TaxID=2890409 RepID=UPI001EF1D696|nr:sodium:proton antiporter [Candidatus Nitrotoga sp. M5]CAH1385451.1 Sodium:proton antiporter [Candidatus Nitrotoga sp. M5]